MTHNQQSTELQTNEGRSRTRKSLPLQLKNLIHLQTKNVVLNIAGSAILAFGLYNIHSLSGVTEGGILGMTLLLQHWLHLSPAVSGFIMNAVCYLIGWRLLGHSFIAYSIIAGRQLFALLCHLRALPASDALDRGDAAVGGRFWERCLSASALASASVPVARLAA